MSKLEVIRREAGPVRVSAWRGGPSMAQVTPTTAQVLPQAAIEGCVASLIAGGYEGAYTSALSPAEQQPFLQAGFVVHEHLSLLRHDLHDLHLLRASVPRSRRRGRARLRRARRSDRRAVLAVDSAAFNPFWQFDLQSLADARTATPSSRFRVAADPAVVGYAVTGRAGAVGYLQRLAVDPDHQGRGVGTALVADSLRWAESHGATAVLVNTQETNRKALSFYQHLGFELEHEGLAVLHKSWRAP